MARSAAAAALIVGRLAEVEAERLVVEVRLTKEPGAIYRVAVDAAAALVATASLELGCLLGVIGTWHTGEPGPRIRATRLERLGPPRP